MSDQEPQSPSQPWGMPPASGQPTWGSEPPYGITPPPGGQPPYGSTPSYGSPPPPPPYGASTPAGWSGGAPAQGALADWASRVGAYLLDAVLLAVPWVILFILGAVVTVFFTVLSYLVIAAGGIWFAIQVGQCGSSPGMRVIGLRCVGKTTGQPIGAGMGFVRGLCHIVDSAICFIGWLWPLWDPDKQTLADKVMSTVVVKVPPQAFSLAPSAGR